MFNALYANRAKKRRAIFQRGSAMTAKRRIKKAEKSFTIRGKPEKKTFAHFGTDQNW